MMARHLGISTTEFLRLYGDNGGTTVRFGEDGRCVFVTAEGCRVHPRRPLVCRLYPLGRATDAEGAESFAVFPKRDGCRAEIGADGTIADFLESQGVEPYFEWSNRYAELYRRMLDVLEGLDVEGRIEEVEGGGAEPLSGPGIEGTTDGAPDRDPVSPWQDIDASLAEYRAAKGIPAPDGIEETIEMHLAAMREWLDDLEARVGASPEEPEGEGEQ